MRVTSCVRAASGAALRCRRRGRAGSRLSAAAAARPRWQTSGMSAGRRLDGRHRELLVANAIAHRRSPPRLRAGAAGQLQRPGCSAAAAAGRRGSIVYLRWPRVDSLSRRVGWRVAGCGKSAAHRRVSGDAPSKRALETSATRILYLIHTYRVQQQRSHRRSSHGSRTEGLRVRRCWHPAAPGVAGRLGCAATTEPRPARSAGQLAAAGPGEYD